MVKRYQFF